MNFVVWPKNKSNQFFFFFNVKRKTELFLRKRKILLPQHANTVKVTFRLHFITTRKSKILQLDCF